MEILSKTTVPAGAILWMIIGAASVWLWITIILLGVAVNSKARYMTAVVKTVCVLIGLVFIFGIISDLVQNRKEQIKVKITENVNLYEFLDTYEIVDREGSILTIEVIKQGDQGKAGGD